MNSNLPKFFAVVTSPGGDQFKVYRNCLEKSFKTLDMYSNIIWPLDRVVLGNFTLPSIKTVKELKRRNNIFIRKWNGRHNRSCEWYMTGSTVEMIYDCQIMNIPVVEITCASTVMPFNTAILQATKVPPSIYPMLPPMPKAVSAI